MAEQSPAKVRYTGASLAYQGASVLGAGFTPNDRRRFGNSWRWRALFAPASFWSAPSLYFARRNPAVGISFELEHRNVRKPLLGFRTFVCLIVLAEDIFYRRLTINEVHNVID